MKKIVPVLVILLILGIGGYFYMNSKGAVPKAPLGTANNTDSNVFTSIKDALSQSLSLKCVYKDEKGVQTTTYIKGGTVRVMMSSSQGDEQPDNILIKDQKMYMWSDSSKTGFMFKTPDPSQVTPGPTSKERNAMYSPEESGSEDQESVLAQIEKYKDACKVETIDDSMFVVPSDVKFQDMNAFTENLKKQVPTTDTESTSDQQKALEELMKQISPEAGDGQ